VASLGLLCWPAGAQVFIDFESPTYAAGDIVGQDGWELVNQDGADAFIIATDNGPSGAGSQCVEMNDFAGVIDHATITIRKFFDDVVSTGGPLITFKYDMKWVVSDPADNGFTASHGIPGSGTGHWWTYWLQRYGVEEPTATNGHWFDSGPNVGYDGEWHTVTYTFVYGDTGDGQTGQLLWAKLDDDLRIKHSNYNIWQETPYVVDRVQLNLAEAYWPSWTFDDRLLIDNLVINGEPLPSDPPVADAGPDVTQDPGSWDGVVLQGGGTDDGEIVRYRWTIGYGFAASLLYDGTEPQPLVDLGTGTYELVLTVFDNDGLRDTDTAIYTIGERPAILDQVAGPWGIKNGDISVTNASDQIPCDTSVGEFEVLNTVIGDAPWGGFPGYNEWDIVFDRFSNLYWVSWNRLLESHNKELQHRWRAHDEGVEKQLGNYSVGNGTLIAGIRYIYVVGGGRDDFGGEPAVYAFEKSTGQLVWETGLVGEVWDYGNPGPKMTLYNDKLYIVGANVLEWVKIHQVDATTGNHDWASDCYVEMQYNELNNPGAVTFVPNAYGEGFHGLFFNQMSTPGTPWNDVYADMVAIKVEPDRGAIVVWGPAEDINGPGLQRSNPIYSETTGLLYTPSFKNIDGTNWPHSLYAWQPSATPSPLVATHTPDEDNVGHGWRYNFALDFDGVTIHAPGEYDAIRSYTDNGDGTFDVVYRDLGGFDETAWGFGHQGCLLQDQNGDSIYFTANESNTDPNEVLRVTSKVYAINLSEAVDPNHPTVTPIAQWVCQEWDPSIGDEGNWDYVWPYYGPTPGPDGSFYIFQRDSSYYYGHRVTRLRLVPGAPVCPGDVDGDGDTDLSDLGALLAAYGSFVGQPNYNPAADFDNDGDVDLTDLGFLLSDYGCLP